MKKLVTFVLIFLVASKLFSQDVKRNLGFGLQSSFPVFGLSAKYGINEQSMVQATIAPFGASSGGGSVKLNFFGARYIYRFPDNNATNVVVDPYLFGGGGIVMYKTEIAGIPGITSTTKSSDSFFGYSVGGGVELILAKAFGISAELGYGKISVSSGVGVNTLLFGGGLHYYIK